MLRRNAIADGSAGRPPEVGPCLGASAYPHYVDFLSQLAWDDGKKRTTGTVMLLCEDGRWKAWLHDRDAGASLWLSGVTLSELMVAIENALANGEGDWRRDRPKPAGSRQR